MKEEEEVKEEEKWEEEEEENGEKTNLQRILLKRGYSDFHRFGETGLAFQALVPRRDVCSQFWPLVLCVMKLERVNSLIPGIGLQDL